MIADVGFVNVKLKQVFCYGGINEDVGAWRASLIATP